MASLPSPTKCMMRKVCKPLIEDMADILGGMDLEQLDKVTNREIVNLWCEAVADNMDWINYSVEVGLKMVKRDFTKKMLDKAVNENGR